MLDCFLKFKSYPNCQISKCGRLSVKPTSNNEWKKEFLIAYNFYRYPKKKKTPAWIVLVHRSGLPCKLKRTLELSSSSRRFNLTPLFEKGEDTLWTPSVGIRRIIKRCFFNGLVRALHASNGKTIIFPWSVTIKANARVCVRFLFKF